MREYLQVNRTIGEEAHMGMIKEQYGIESIGLYYMVLNLIFNNPSLFVTREDIACFTRLGKPSAEKIDYYEEMIDYMVDIGIFTEVRGKISFKILPNTICLS